MTTESEQYRRLKNKICSNLHVKVLSINNWDRTVEIPSEIALLQELEEIHIYRNSQIKKFPQELADLPILRMISHKYSFQKQIPEIFCKIPKLDTLILSQNNYGKSARWSVLSKAMALETLDLSYSLKNFQSLPEEICNIVHLRELNISGNKLQHLPACMNQLKYLEVLHCEGNNFLYFPAILTRMPSLKKLIISALALRDLPEEVLDLQHLNEVVFTAKNSKKTPDIFNFERLLKNIQKYNYTKEQQLFFLRIIKGEKKIKKLNNEQILSLINCGIPKYTNSALSEIESRIQHNEFGKLNWPVAGDKVVIRGKISGKVSELKKRLWQNDISTGFKINKKTTHILLGSNHNLAYSEIMEYQSNLLTEQLTVNFLNKMEKPYLLSSPEKDNIENIRQLIHSENTENILLGLEILKSGGFPMELMTELFLIYKFNRNQKIKRIIYQILGQYAPLKFVSILKSRKPISSFVSETTCRRNLEFYCAAGNLDRRYIAFYLLKKRNRGHLFALFNLETKDKQIYFSKALKDGFLSLSGLQLTELPDDLSAIPGLKHLDISFNKFSSIPEVLFELKELKSLFIRGLYEIHKNPQDLWSIRTLESIYVGYNHRWACKLLDDPVIKGIKVISR